MHERGAGAGAAVASPRCPSDPAVFSSLSCELQGETLVPPTVAGGDEGFVKFYLFEYEASDNNNSG